MDGSIDRQAHFHQQWRQRRPRRQEQRKATATATTRPAAAKSALVIFKSINWARSIYIAVFPTRRAAREPSESAFSALFDEFLPPARIDLRENQLFASLFADQFESRPAASKAAPYDTPPASTSPGIYGPPWLKRAHDFWWAPGRPAGYLPRFNITLERILLFASGRKLFAPKADAAHRQAKQAAPAQASFGLSGRVN